MGKDHYIPQVYINKFSDIITKKLYFYNKNHRKIKVESCYSSQICYGKDTYYLSEDTSSKYQVDKTYLDKEILHFYETNMPKHFNSLLDGTSQIENKHTIFIGEFLILLKMRSRYFRNAIYNERNISNTIAKIGLEIKSTGEVNPKALDNYVEDVKAKSRTEEYQSQQHSNSLFSIFVEQREQLDKALGRLLNHTWRMLYAPLGTQYISSDNPGFFCNSDDSTQNTQFGGDGLFILPLSPYQALQIDLSSPDTISPTYKNIISVHVPSSTVDAINTLTIRYAVKTLFGLSKTNLESASKLIQS